MGYQTGETLRETHRVGGSCFLLCKVPYLRYASASWRFLPCVCRVFQVENGRRACGGGDLPLSIPFCPTSRSYPAMLRSNVVWCCLCRPPGKQAPPPILYILYVRILELSKRLESCTPIAGPTIDRHIYLTQQTTDRHNACRLQQMGMAAPQPLTLTTTPVAAANPDLVGRAGAQR